MNRHPSVQCLVTTKDGAMVLLARGFEIDPLRSGLLIAKAFPPARYGPGFGPGSGGQG